MSKKTYIVYRSMTGDKDYERGDEREMNEADAAALVASGALAEKGTKPLVREPGVVHGPVDNPSFDTEIVQPPREPSVKVADHRKPATTAKTKDQAKA